MTQDDSTPQAMVMLIGAMLLLPAMDAIAKWLAGAVSSGQVTWSRFFFQVLFMSPLLLRTRGAWLTPALWLHAARGALIAAATLFFFTGLAYLPMADAISIFFVAPLLVTLLAALLFGETIHWRRISAICFGFAGAMIIIRPSFSEVGPAALYPLGTAVCFSFYILLTRKLVRSEDPIRLQFFAGVFGCLVMSAAGGVGAIFPIGVLAFAWPTPSQWALLGGVGLLATLCHLLVVYAYQRAPVGLLAPFHYVEIIGATLLGYFVFGDFPDALTWFGISIIVGSGIYVFRREAALARRQQVTSGALVDAVPRRRE